MGTQVKVELSPDQILKTRGLQVGDLHKDFLPESSEERWIHTFRS